VAPDRGNTVADLARLAGISARSLRYAFHGQYGTTPMRYLRQVRLDRAREDLSRAHGSVADIAYYWGFANLSRFARAYRDRFGEFPAATLKAGRPPGPATEPRLASRAPARCAAPGPERTSHAHAPSDAGPCSGSPGGVAQIRRPGKAVVSVRPQPRVRRRH
jgi:AraC-like DNA-binding protein